MTVHYMVDLEIKSAVLQTPLYESHTSAHLAKELKNVVTSSTDHHALTVKQGMLNLPKQKLIHDLTTQCNTAHNLVARYVEQQPAIYSAFTMDTH